MILLKCAQVFHRWRSEFSCGIRPKCGIAPLKVPCKCPALKCGGDLRPCPASSLLPHGSVSFGLGHLNQPVNARCSTRSRSTSVGGLSLLSGRLAVTCSARRSCQVHATGRRPETAAPRPTAAAARASAAAAAAGGGDEADGDDVEEEGLANSDGGDSDPAGYGPPAPRTWPSRTKDASIIRAPGRREPRSR